MSYINQSHPEALEGRNRDSPEQSPSQCREAWRTVHGGGMRQDSGRFEMERAGGRMCRRSQVVVNDVVKVNDPIVVVDTVEVENEGEQTFVRLRAWFAILSMNI